MSANSRANRSSLPLFALCPAECKVIKVAAHCKGSLHLLLEHTHTPQTGDATPVIQPDAVAEHELLAADHCQSSRRFLGRGHSEQAGETVPVLEPHALCSCGGQRLPCSLHERQPGDLRPFPW